MNPYKYDGYPKEKDFCLCDDDFIGWIQDENITGKNIFHLGTGMRHHVGLNATNAPYNNYVLGITISVEEHQAYIDLISHIERLDGNYHVLYANMYNLTICALPNFDILYIPHLGEYYKNCSRELVRYNDMSLYEMLLKKLNSNGQIVLFTKSPGYQIASSLIKSSFQQNKIIPYRSFNNLKIYRTTKRFNENRPFC